MKRRKQRERVRGGGVKRGRGRKTKVWKGCMIERKEKKYEEKRHI
jgi:hypothetical protein